MNLKQTLCGTTVCYPLSLGPAFGLERALAGISGAGLRHVELVAIPGYCEHVPVDRMNDQAVAELAGLLRNYSLEPVAINVAANLTTMDGINYFAHACRVAEGLGAATVVTAIEQTATPEGESRFLQHLPALLFLAQQYHITIALETHGGLINTGMEGLALLKRLDSERVKLTYDMANVVYYGGVLPEEDLAQMGSNIGRVIGHVHLKDKATFALREYQFPVFGQGILDFRTVLDLLARGGYHGVMAVEVELDGAPASPELVDEAIVQSLAYLEEL